MASRQRARLQEMIAYARARSPFYRELYRTLPATIDDVSRLPVTSKTQLMDRFDDWSTDRNVTLAMVRAFADDPEMIGARFLGKYTVATTSGTTGLRGIFLVDDRSLALASAISLQAMSEWLSWRERAALAARGARLAMVIATGGHFASTVAATRMTRGRLRRRAIRVFSVQARLAETVAGLNRFRPAILAAYASTALLLAAEQEAGRLRIDPVLVTVTAEGLPAPEYERIARAFGAQVRNSYAANECPFLSSSCEHGWLHVNADWAVLEPVDAEHRPVLAGEPSYTVLLSNLCNRLQPVLRYDLGDSVLVRPEPCPCGSALPAIGVQGRAADVLTIPTPSGDRTRIAPLVLGTVLDRTPGIELSQIVQTAPTVLRVRLRTAASADPVTVWDAATRGLEEILARQGLAHVAVERADEPPQQTPGGKHREVIPLG